MCVQPDHLLPLKCVCLATPISLLYVNTNHNISLLTSRTRVEGFLHTLCPYEIYNPKEEIEWLLTEEEHELSGRIPCNTGR